jgi:hypothetical protein
VAAASGCGDDESEGVDAQGGRSNQGGNTGTGGSSGKGGAGNATGGTTSGAGESGAGAPDGAGQGGAGAEPTEKRVYVVARHVSTGDAWTTYLDAAVVDSLDDLEAFDALDNGIEIDGYVIPVVLNGATYVPDAVAPTITRYDLNASNQLVKGDTISFAGRGLTFVFQSHIAVVNNEKAYLFDAATQRAIIWNPASMELTGGEIDLVNEVVQGYDPAFWPDMGRLKDGKLIVPVNYSNADGPLRESNLVVIDTETDSVSKFVSDDRCQPVHVSVELDNGDVYFFPNAGQTETFYVDVESPRPPTCGLRVLEGEDEFDSDYVLELGELAGGNQTRGGAAQGGFPDGRGGFYFSVLDEDRYAEREENGYSYYRLWHYDLKTPTELTDQDWWSGAMSRWTQFGADSVVLNYGADENDEEFTIVYDGSQDPLAPFRMPGIIEPIARLK